MKNFISQKKLNRLSEEQRREGRQRAAQWLKRIKGNWPRNEGGKLNQKQFKPKKTGENLLA